jgi:cleavage and polyadenylation specificity factor subunit 4
MTDVLSPLYSTECRNFTFDFEEFIKSELGLDLDKPKKKEGTSAKPCTRLPFPINPASISPLMLPLFFAPPFLPDEHICKYFLRGTCHKGAACQYKHTRGGDREKSVVCKHWLRGLCKKGEHCEFLHVFNMKKMPECWFYSKYGECCNGDECLYQHIDPESKVKECPWYARGFCKHGK